MTTPRKMAKILGGVKFQHFGPPLRPKKCFLQLQKWGWPKIDDNFGCGEHGHHQEGGPKKAKIQHWVKPDIFKITGPNKGTRSIFTLVTHIASPVASLLSFRGWWSDLSEKLREERVPRPALSWRICERAQT